MPEVTIRLADPSRDAAACAAIYAPSVMGSATSFEEVPPPPGEMARRIDQAVIWLVAERGGAIAGYAYASPHRERDAYRWAVDVAVYVDARHRRAGVGRALYEELLDRLRGRGYRVACAGVTQPNPASEALHAALGFQPVGTYRRIGWKAGAWRDVRWWQLELDPAGAEPPAEPLRG